ncbi:hypothetical protein KIN20_019748 [Parelaphostrongylus tenuis]|uniref:Uncharacterized protein n=1 Tax=Parelaphostrongylus tenuis TaxID=148309 RepID=A0AAD5N584_PARTN|nr:hypothetical protein KIN20_019748 [Parelaphostrongylus tenuis]
MSRGSHGGDFAFRLPAVPLRGPNFEVDDLALKPVSSRPSVSAIVVVATNESPFEGLGVVIGGDILLLIGSCSFDPLVGSF